MTFSPSVPALLLTAFVMSLFVDVTRCDYRVGLERVRTLKVPSYTGQGERVFKFGAGSVNKMSYDFHTRLLYVVGGPDLHVINVTRAGKLHILDRTPVRDAMLHDVTTCDELVVATYTQSNRSGLLIARTYNEARGAPVILKRILHDTSDPVSLAVTSNCDTAVIAVNGKALWDGKEYVDRRPAVVLVSLPDILKRETTDETKPVVVLNFRNFDARSEELEKQGIRFPMRGRVGGLSEDLDPSHVTIDNFARKAYVTLKVNNALAVIDLDARNVTALTSLGLKDWRGGDIDVCDTDGVRFQQYPIYSFYQPSGISTVLHSGDTYLLTANAGDKRDYSHLIHWTEAITGSDLVNKDLIGDAVENELLSALKNKTKLGSLHFTKLNGQSGKMTKFITFGGRSFSLWSLPDLDLVYDSGSDVERQLARRAKDVFNCPVKGGPNVVRYDRDQTSVDVGPQPISITSGRLGSLTLIFVGLANPGGVLVYSMPLGSDRPRFESMWMGIRDALKSWDELYVEADLAGIRTEDMIYIPNQLTGSKFPWLLVVGSKSGTVTLLRVRGSGDIPVYSSSTGTLATFASTVVVFSLMMTWAAVGSTSL